jgi:hypothetical protein
VPIVIKIHNKSEAICNKSQSLLASLLKILKALMFHQNNKSAYLTWTLLTKLTPDKLKSECKYSTTKAITLLPLYHSTTIAITTSPLPTNLLMQSLFFMTNLDKTDDGTSCRGITNQENGIPRKHLQLALMDTALTPDRLNTPDANDSCERKGGIKGRGITTRIYSNKENNKKKIIFLFLILFHVSVTFHVTCS